MSLLYYWSKMLKEACGAAIGGSTLCHGSQVEVGTAFVSSVKGRNSFCVYGCEVVKSNVGPFCSIANHVAIGGGQHPMDWVGMSPVFYESRDSVAKKFSTLARPPHKRVTVRSDVWIGYRAIVLQGLTIAHGAAIGAHSVVIRDVESYSTVAGRPVRDIHYRLDAGIRGATSYQSLAET